MKVLFAVSNENISEAIVRKYQKDYKEIISYKNVYYFNAILKEIQKDKSYDRIVISEDLEPFANNNYDQIDKFIFDKLDSISDEATNSDRADTPIILICTDRRTKSEDILVKLFSIGIYSAILGNDRNVEEICKLIRVPRTKKEAKIYYRIDADDATYQSEDENGVSESEIQNILAHYKKLGKNEEKYVESFNTIAKQYTDDQLKVIINFLPMNVKAVLESNSPKYQQLVTTTSGTQMRNEYKAPAQQNPEGSLNINYIESKSGRENLGRPVVIPSTVNTKNVKKINSKQQPVQQFDEIEDFDIDMDDTETNEPEFEDISFDDILGDTSNNTQNNNLNNNLNVAEQPKRGRGRPRKNPVADESIQASNANVPKRGRGRPKKNSVPESEIEEPMNLFDLADNDENMSMGNMPKIPKASNTMLPGFDDIDDDDFVEQDTNQNVSGGGTLPGFDDIDDDDDYADDEEDIGIFSQPQPKISNQYSNINQYTPPTAQTSQGYRPNSSQYMPNSAYTLSSSYMPNTTEMSSTNNIDYTTNHISNLLTKDKKLVAFLGTSKNGTSFLVNNVAESLSSSGINVAILDATRNKNAYYIYTKNEEDLRQKAAKCIQKLINGVADGIKVNKNLTVYTSIPEEDVGMNNYEAILSTLVNNYSVVLIDCDFGTNFGFLASVQEIYLVQSMDVLTIQPLTAFMRELKTKNILDPEKIRIVINKETKVRNLSPKTIIGGMSFYNDPAMSFMTELFNRDKVKYCIIPFEEMTYSRYLEGLVNCKISLAGYSREFLQALKTLENMVYPLIGSKTMGGYNNTFSNDMNNTLNQMKNKF